MFNRVVLAYEKLNVGIVDNLPKLPDNSKTI